MKAEIIREYSAEKFRRITGVQRSTFEKMLEILEKAMSKKLARGGGENQHFQRKKCF